MSVTIVRSLWIDDDGTGTTGTVINQAVHTALYNEIDTALAKVAQLAGGNSFTGNQSVAGLLTVNAAAGVNLFQTTGNQFAQITIQNPSVGTNAGCQFVMQSDTAYLAILALSSGLTPSGYAQPNGVAIATNAAAGLAIQCHTAAPIKLNTNGTERMRIQSTGEVLINTVSPFNSIPAHVHVLFQGNTGDWGQAIKLTVDQPNAPFMGFLNAAGAAQGSINATSASSTLYSTASDQRLKTDGGRATDLSALRNVVVHDFAWKADGTTDRGVFAQEAHALFPRAVVEGTDDTTDDGTLTQPWMTDYSKFVPDLIAGWQQHDAEIAELRAALAAAKG